MTTETKRATVFICGVPCDCDTDGPGREWYDEDTGCTISTATCSKCGQSAIDVSLLRGDE
jgi:hypothetical protein